MAERKRRGGPAADGHEGDEAVVETAADDAVIGDEALDDLADDEFDDEVDDADGAAEGSERVAGGGTITKTRSKKDKKAAKSSDRPGVFARLANFFREVVAELRKVIWPTRSELLRYTVVVVVFVTIILTIVGLLDYGFAKGVLWVFANKGK